MQAYFVHRANFYAYPRLSGEIYVWTYQSVAFVALSRPAAGLLLAARRMFFYNFSCSPSVSSAAGMEPVAGMFLR